MISTDQISELRRVFDGEVLENEPMSNQTTLKIGGNADLLLKPISKEGIVEAIKFFEESSIPYMALGRGSNLLVGDEGIRGAVIAMKYGLDHISYEDDLVTAGASYDWPKLTLDTIKAGLQGLEATAGIPATVGGAIMMNAGAYGTEVFDVITEVEVIRDHQFISLKKEEINYGYRHTDLTDDIILQGTFQLNKIENIDEVLEKRKQLLAERNASQPLNKPCVGSVFKNPDDDHAGRLIEACELKGFSNGNVQVSPKHANFFVNTGGGTAKEMMDLIKMVQQKVEEKFSVRLEMEVKKIGSGF
ncbi:MAG: UDP-N-acetylmuramate dehydrogenase [Bacteroidetes bacterium]|nr:UDP-N-acetylmuramate dehydrogenase [Bacteroidota bacterium]